MFTVSLRFRGDLRLFLAKDHRAEGLVRRRLGEKTSVKDVIEACGVPHPEVDLIAAGEVALGLEDTLENAAELEIHPVPAPADLLPAAPRLQTRRLTRFIADVHLGKLVRDLRLLGIDVAAETGADDPRLLEIMVDEDRALLTRDRRLLMRSIVRHGYCPRSDKPLEQTREVLGRFDLRPVLEPWSRCLRCNGPLVAAAKHEVAVELAGQPRTLRYHEHFNRCADCRQIYWTGSHHRELESRLARLFA